MSRIIRTLILVLLGVATVHAEEGLKAFETAMEAFRSGDYGRAAQAFEQARAEGLDRPALYYNLGVTYYRLERWPEAEAAFRETAESVGMAPLAYYNLGLVARKRGDLSGAAQWFERCIAASEDEKLRFLARKLLAELPERGADRNVFLSAGLGYDDNVTLENDDLAGTSGESDGFVELFGYLQGVLAGTRREGWLMRGSLFGELYREQTDYSLSEINLGLYKTFPVWRWNSEAGANFSYSTLGGNAYTRSANLSLNARRDLSDSMSLRWRLRWRQIRSLDAVAEALEGNSADGRLEGQWRFTAATRLRAYYELEVNDREDSETATTFSSLSPTRHSLSADYSFPLSRSWDAKLSGSYRLSRYDDANVEADGEVVTREDDRFKLAAEFNRRFAGGKQLLLEYSYTDNSSNIERYDYKRNLVMANILFEF